VFIVKQIYHYNLVTITDTFLLLKKYL